MAHRNNQRKSSRASPKGTSFSPQKPMPPPTNPALALAPMAPMDYRTPYANLLLSNDERFECNQQVKAQKAQVTHINASSDESRQKMESLENVTPGMALALEATGNGTNYDFRHFAVSLIFDNTKGLVLDRLHSGLEDILFLRMA